MINLPLNFLIISSIFANLQENKISIAISLKKKIKILDLSDKRAFSYKFYTVFFFFNRIFHLFLRPLNMLSTSFRAKMAKLHSGRISLPVGTLGIFVQNLPEFFFLEIIFHFFQTTKYAIYKFRCKNANIAFWSKFWTCRTKGHFRKNITRVLFFIVDRIFQLFMRPLNIISTSLRAKISKR